jgi:hypothetical protein
MRIPERMTSEINEHGEGVTIIKNPWRPSNFMRVEQKKWLPHRELLYANQRRLENATAALKFFQFVVLGCGFAGWVDRWPFHTPSFLCFSSAAMWFGFRYTEKWYKEIADYIKGMDKLYQLPLICDECEADFLQPKVNKCGKCEVCPRCNLPYDPSINECNSCQSERLVARHP